MWSVDNDEDFVLLRLDTTGTTVISAFGFGGSTGPSERSFGPVYIEHEDAAVVTFLDRGASCVYIAKVTIATSVLLWSYKTCVDSLYS